MILVVKNKDADNCDVVSVGTTRKDYKLAADEKFEEIHEWPPGEWRKAELNLNDKTKKLSKK